MPLGFSVLFWYCVCFEINQISIVTYQKLLDSLHRKYSVFSIPLLLLFSAVPTYLTPYYCHVSVIVTTVLDT